jgi:uncharacterized protein DUF5681
VAEDLYDVGYRKPPKAFQFQKGRSGNPSGRPREPLGFPDMLAKAAKQKVLVNQKNGPKYITKEEAICMQLVNKAAGGDPKAIELYAKLRMIYSPGMVKPEDMDAMASSVKAKLFEMFEASEESSGEGTAESDQSSDQANTIAPECDRSGDLLAHPVESDGEVSLLAENRSTRLPENHATLNSTNQLLPESPFQDRDGDAPP